MAGRHHSGSIPDFRLASMDLGAIVRPQIVIAETMDFTSAFRRRHSIDIVKESEKMPHGAWTEWRKEQGADPERGAWASGDLPSLPLLLDGSRVSCPHPEESRWVAVETTFRLEDPIHLPREPACVLPWPQSLWLSPPLDATREFAFGLARGKTLGLAVFPEDRLRWSDSPHCVHCGFQLRSTGSGVCDERIWVHGNVWNLLQTLNARELSGQRVAPAVLLWATFAQVVGVANHLQPTLWHLHSSHHMRGIVGTLTNQTRDSIWLLFSPSSFSLILPLHLPLFSAFVFFFFLRSPFFLSPSFLLPLLVSHFFCLPPPPFS